MKRAAKLISWLASGQMSIALDLLAVWFVQEHLGWQFPFVLLIAVGLTVALVMYFVSAVLEDLANTADETMLAKQPSGAS